jgi:PadR family transcriptional regulator, regulatory protein PadR
MYICLRILGMDHLLRGSLETIVIKLLADHGEMYGYEISQKVKELSAAKINLTEGALYPTLHKLEGRGILAVDTRSIGNRYRKYYTLTEQGRGVLESLLSDMQSYIDHMQSILFSPLKPQNAIWKSN